MTPFKKIDNNENLLITLGDSWTEGVGCYPNSIITKFHSQKKDFGEFVKEEYGEQAMHLPTFNTGSWAYQLGNSLGYDLINLGEGGTSNSYAAKQLINEQDYNYLSTYKNVIVVWLLTEPARFSFYSKGVIGCWMPSYPTTNRVRQRFLQSYFEDVNPSFLDDSKETRFYLKAVDYYCKAKGYKFAYSSAFTNFEEFEDISNNMHKYTTYKNFNTLLGNIDKRSLYAPCGHPNETGYQYISDAMSKILKDNLKLV
jgi:hypothetical protein